MKKLILIFSAFLVFQYSDIYAQKPLMPQSSTAQTVTQDFALGQIKLSYSRPNIKGRKIFGGLLPYGEVWRTGANSATAVTFSDEVKIEGQTVPAGTYALFTIPGEKEWTVILNKNTKQWGAYSYKPEENFLQVKVKPVKLQSKIETFTIEFADVQPSSCTLSIKWENVSVPVSITSDIDGRVMANIAEAMKGEKKPYLQAAQYYYQNNKDLNKALEWANKAEKADQKAPWIKYWKARIQLRIGDKQGAAATASAGIKAAEAADNAEYIRLNKELLAEAGRKKKINTEQNRLI